MGQSAFGCFSSSARAGLWEMKRARARVWSLLLLQRVSVCNLNDVTVRHFLTSQTTVTPEGETSTYNLEKSQVKLPLKPIIRCRNAKYQKTIIIFTQRPESQERDRAWSVQFYICAVGAERNHCESFHNWLRNHQYDIVIIVSRPKFYFSSKLILWKKWTKLTYVKM